VGGLPTAASTAAAMSRNRNSLPQAAPQFVPQQSRSAAELSPYHGEIRQQIHEGKMPTPAGRLQLNSMLGFPDFEPATSDADEDQLTNERLAKGWKNNSPDQTEEFGSMEDCFHEQPHQILSMREKLGIPVPREGHRRPKKLRAKSTLFPEPGASVEGGLSAWLARLADPQVPLTQLIEKGVPYVPPSRGYVSASRCRHLLDLLSADENSGAQRGGGGGAHSAAAGGRERDGVPLVRALWFAKVTILKEFIDKDKNEEPLAVQVKSEALEKRTDEFTHELTKYLLDHFENFAQKKGKCAQPEAVESLVKRWAYLERFVDWCYHEGVLNKALYCKWVVETLCVHIGEQTAAAWCAIELMFPLILNTLPDLCRFCDGTGEVPLLITACIHRYMRECVVLRPGRDARGGNDPMDLAGGQPQDHLGGAGPQGGGVGAGAGGGVAAAGGIRGGSVVGAVGQKGEVSANVLDNVKKLVKTLVLLSPEAYLALEPEVRMAWHMIEREPCVRDIDVVALKSMLYDDLDLSESSTMLAVSMPWADDLRSTGKLGEDVAADKLMFDLVEKLDKCCRRHRAAGQTATGAAAPTATAGLWDVQRLKQFLESERERERERSRHAHPSPPHWLQVIQEHCRARSLVRIVCTWAVRHGSEPMGEAIYIAAALLKWLGDGLAQVCALTVRTRL